jgi:hypothetical protein
VREVLRERMEQVGCDVPLERNGAIRQREVGLERAAGWLADRFLSSPDPPAPTGT